MSLVDSNGAVRGKSSSVCRALYLVTAMSVCGCATQHGDPQPLPPAATAAPDVSRSGAAAASVDVETRRVAAAARKLNLDVVKKDGQVVFCRSSVVTGSRFQKDRQCFTADQVEAMQEQTQQSGSQ